MVGLRIVFVDVGHGDAIILRYGSWTGLIDGGPGGSGLTIAKELTLTGADHVDTLLITHAHNDHIGGLLDNVTFGGQSGQLIDLIDPSQVYYGLAPSSSLTGSGGSCSDWPDLWNTHLESFPTKLHQVHAGDSLSWGGPSAVVLNPPKGAPAPTTDANANADSVVVRLTFGGKGFLFAGDLTSGDNENTVATQLQGGPPIYLLKVAHHGFGDATSSGFVNAAFIRKTPFPHVAVISCGSDSGSKPPATTNLWAANTPVYSTLNSGTISLTVTSSGKATWNFPDYHVVANKQDTPLTDSLRVTVQPQSQTVKAGQTASFTAAAPGKPSVEWQVSTDGSGSWTELPGSFSPAATSTTYTFTARTVQNGNHYRAVFTNSLGSATSNAAMLTVK
jgi:beta-lactamase superfamily II metal-dependent hydrolase